MTPVIFPLTYLSKCDISKIFEYFETVALYLPHSEMIPEAIRQPGLKERVQLSWIPGADEQRLKKTLSHFQQWAHQHGGPQGLGADFLLAHKGAVPFMDEDAISAIRSQIKKGSAPDSSPEADDRLFEARLFLAMAHSLDHDHDSLKDDFDQLAVMESELLKRMHGPDPSGNLGKGIISSTGGFDPGAHLTGERLTHWARLFLAAPYPDAQFVTPSRAVMEYLQERTPNLIELAHESTPSPVGPNSRSTLLDRLNQVIASDDPASTVVPHLTGSACLRLFIARDMPPHRFFSGLAGADPGSLQKTESLGGPSHTLLILLEAG
jgi:hypothetical protein